MQQSNWRILLFLLISCLIIISLPFFVKNQRWLHIVILAGLESIVVMGFVLQHKVRLLTFCPTTFWGIGAYISGVLAINYHINFWLCLPLAAIGTALIAFLVGSVVVRAGFVTFLMISIVIAEIFVEVLGHIGTVGGWEGISGIPAPAIGSFVFLSKLPYYYITFGLVGICALIFYALYRSPIGKAWTAIGQSGGLAASIGVNLFRYQLVAFVIAGFTSGLSGSMYAHYSGYVVPSTFDIMRSLYVAISAAIGGLHFVIVGPIIGTFIIKALPEVFRITDKYEPIFVGVMIVLCARFLQEGVLNVLLKRTAGNP